MKITPKINASAQVTVDSCGKCYKHVVVALRGEQTIAGVLADPDIWTNMQGDGAKRCGKGDLVTVISPDGLGMADRVMVTRAEAGRLWFSKPLRMIIFDEVACFSDGRFAVEPKGTGYVIKSVRTKEPEPKLFTTAKAAEVEILRRQPSKVA